MLLRRPLLAAALLLACAPGLRAQPALLRTAVDGTFAPHAMAKLSGGVEGFNVDLAEALGREMGRPVEVEAISAAGLIPGLNSAKYDFIAAPWTVTAERAEQLLFTEPYLDTNLRFALRRGSPEMTGPEDLRGKVLAVNKGSLYDGWARANEGRYGFTTQAYDTQSDAVQAVLQNRAYANLAANTVLLWTAKAVPALSPGFELSTGQFWSIPVRKDDVAMRDRLDLAIKCLKAKGEVARIAERWFGKPGPDSAATKPFPGRGTPGFAGYDPTPQPACP